MSKVMGERSEPVKGCSTSSGAGLGEISFRVSRFFAIFGWFSFRFVSQQKLFFVSFRFAKVKIYAKNAINAPLKMDLQNGNLHYRKWLFWGKFEIFSPAAPIFYLFTPNFFKISKFFEPALRIFPFLTPITFKILKIFLASALICPLLFQENAYKFWNFCLRRYFSRLLFQKL